MGQSLSIPEAFLDEMTAVFSNSSVEEGFLLGCSSQINRITHIVCLPASRAGRHYYAPDTLQANQSIRSWADRGICFCGFVHSHVTDKQELSEADLQFAEALFQACRLPVLWFGLAVVTGGNVDFHFYSVKKYGGNIHLSPALFEQKTVLP